MHYISFACVLIKSADFFLYFFKLPVLLESSLMNRDLIVIPGLVNEL